MVASYSPEKVRSMGTLYGTIVQGYLEHDKIIILLSRKKELEKILQRDWSSVIKTESGVNSKG